MASEEDGRMELVNEGGPTFMVQAPYQESTAIHSFTAAPTDCPG